MWIRYFATTDDSPAGRVALTFLKAMVRIWHVRAVGLSAEASESWMPWLRRLGATAAVGHDFVTVVCAPPERWTWVHTVHARRRKETDPPEVIQGRLELYTAGVRNVLIAPFPPTNAHESETARKYDVILVADLQGWPASIAPVIYDHAHDGPYLHEYITGNKGD